MRLLFAFLCLIATTEPLLAQYRQAPPMPVTYQAPHLPRLHQAPAMVCYNGVCDPVQPVQWSYQPPPQHLPLHDPHAVYRVTYPPPYQPVYSVPYSTFAAPLAMRSNCPGGVCR